MEGLQHFCIYGEDILSLLIKKYNPTMVGSVNLKIDWKYIFDSSSNSKFIFIDNSNGWNYLIWNNFDVTETILFLKNLSYQLDTKVNYYFVDGQIDAARWIISNKGELIEGICYQLGDFQYIMNYNQSQLEIIAGNAYSSFWNMYEKLANPLFSLNDDIIQVYYCQFN